MSTSDIPRILCLALVSTLAGCDDPSGLAGESDAPRDAPVGFTEPLADGGAALRAAVCSPHVMVARSQDGSCDSVGAWVAHRVFPGSGSPSLAQYCRYTWPHPESPPPGPAVDALVASVGEGDIGADCQAVTPEADAIGEVAGAAMRDIFYWSAGRVRGEEIVAAYPQATRAPVTVAVVDTYPSHEPPDPVSNHGPIVASLVDAFACPGGPCPVIVTHTLGLPRVDEDKTPDLVRGGVVGTQSDLARGIYDAVRDSPDAQRLIINLSVGWDARLFGGEGFAVQAPAVEAVRSALEYARCSGALVIAAAGNDGDLTCTEEALAPARWEEEPAPDATTCEALVGPGHATFGGGYEPLVFAVGGLSWSGAAMPGTRHDGVPRLAASATRAPAAPRAGLDEPVVRTGTSMAAAAVTGAASLIWSLDPSLTPAGVMDILYANGHPVGVQRSDFGPNGGNDPVHSLDVCEAVVAACEAGACGSLSSTATPLDCEPPVPVSTADLFALISNAASEFSHNETGDTVTACGEICGSERFVYGPPQTEVECADYQRNPLLRLTNPQPGRPGCEDCGLTVEQSGDGVAHVTLNGDFDNYTILSASVDVVDPAGDVHSFPLTTPDLNQPDTYIGKNLSSKTIDEITIELSKTGITPVSSKLLIKFDDGHDTEDPMMLAID